jgi:hypothetical protein
MTELKTSEKWLKEPDYLGLTVMDPDGWDRSNFHESWNECITQAEFEKRLLDSTIIQDTNWLAVRNKLKQFTVRHCEREIVLNVVLTMLMMARDFIDPATDPSEQSALEMVRLINNALVLAKHKDG